MGERQNTSKIINLSERAFQRDKDRAGVELKNYFVTKNKQIKAAQLTSAITSSLKKEVFSCAEANKLTDFLARKFDIRGPAIQYAEAGNLYGSSVQRGKKVVKKTPLRMPAHKGSDLFHELFQRLQAAVQENLLDYNGARVLVRDVVANYPASRGSLRR